LSRSKKYISQEEALAKLQRFCAYQDRCHQEVRSKLIDLGIYGDSLEEIIANLIQDNFLNEERFARSYARGKFRIKQWGRNRIKKELFLRNISAYCIKKALEEIDEEHYVQTMDHLIEKRRTVIKEKNLFVLRGKIANYLIGKGYESHLAWERTKNSF
jgi:regulatory protein